MNTTAEEEETELKTKSHTNVEHALTVEGSVPHPLGDDSARRPIVVHRQGLVQSVSVEHQTVVKASSYDVHLTKTKNRTKSLLLLFLLIILLFTSAYLCFILCGS